MTRNMSDRFRGLLCSVLLLLPLICLSSCYPEFENPIPPLPGLKADRQILGTWLRTTKTSKTHLLIFQRKNGWIDVVLIDDSEESEDGIDVGTYEGYSTSVNKQKFLCLRFRKKDHNYSDDVEAQEVHFYIANYESPSKDRLIIKLFSLQKVKELIQEGKLKGEVVKQGQVDKVTVTSSSDQLVEVISKEGVGAFVEQGKNDVLVFSRKGD